MKKMKLELTKSEVSTIFLGLDTAFDEYNRDGDTIIRENLINVAAKIAKQVREQERDES